MVGLWAPCRTELTRGLRPWPILSLEVRGCPRGEGGRESRALLETGVGEEPLSWVGSASGFPLQPCTPSPGPSLGAGKALASAS